MITSLLLAAAIWPAAVTQHCEPNTDVVMIGIAENPKGDLLYCELITQPTPSTINVNYANKHKIFAEKKLTFSDNPSIPSVTQEDFRFGELRKASVTHQQVELNYQANNQKNLNKVILPTKDVDVIDAGFDNFVRTHWDDLIKGNKISLNFASMSHLKLLALRISVQPASNCASKGEKQYGEFCFLVEIDNALLRLLLGNIKLAYDEQHRLKEFNGVVNVEDEHEASQTAIIHYYYKQDYLVNTTEAQ